MTKTHKSSQSPLFAFDDLYFMFTIFRLTEKRLNWEVKQVGEKSTGILSDICRIRCDFSGDKGDERSMRSSPLSSQLNKGRYSEA